MQVEENSNSSSTPVDDVMLSECSPTSSSKSLEKLNKLISRLAVDLVDQELERDSPFQNINVKLKFQDDIFNALRNALTPSSPDNNQLHNGSSAAPPVKLHHLWSEFHSFRTDVISSLSNFEKANKQMLRDLVSSNNAIKDGIEKLNTSAAFSGAVLNSLCENGEAQYQTVHSNGMLGYDDADSLNIRGFDQGYSCNEKSIASPAPSFGSFHEQHRQEVPKMTIKYSDSPVGGKSKSRHRKSVAPKKLKIESSSPIISLPPPIAQSPAPVNIAQQDPNASAAPKNGGSQYSLEDIPDLIERKIIEPREVDYRNSQRRSIVWQHYLTLYCDDQLLEVVQCKHCLKPMNWKLAYGTSRLGKHLQTCSKKLGFSVEEPGISMAQSFDSGSDSKFQQLAADTDFVEVF